jgi:hypothetical protein
MSRINLKFAVAVLVVSAGSFVAGAVYNSAGNEGKGRETASAAKGEPSTNAAAAQGGTAASGTQLDDSAALRVVGPSAGSAASSLSSLVGFRPSTTPGSSGSPGAASKGLKKPPGVPPGPPGTTPPPNVPPGPPDPLPPVPARGSPFFP